MKLPCPFSPRFLLHVFNLPAAGAVVEEVIHNRKTWEMMTEILISCCKGPEDILTKLEKKIIDIGLEGFLAAWAPGEDVCALIDCAAFNGSVWIDDCAFGDASQDEEMNASLARCWAEIPNTSREVQKSKNMHKEDKKIAPEEKVQALCDITVALHPKWNPSACKSLSSMASSVCGIDSKWKS